MRSACQKCSKELDIEHCILINTAKRCKCKNKHFFSPYCNNCCDKNDLRCYSCDKIIEEEEEYGVIVTTNKKIKKAMIHRIFCSDSCAEDYTLAGHITYRAGICKHSNVYVIFSSKS